MSKKRVIFLADLQSFYASCEKAERPNLRDKPVAVAGDPERRSGIVLTACPIAKSFGIKTGETLRDAMGKLPTLIAIKPRMWHYIKVSMQIMDVYYRFTPLVESYSIDECFLDATESLQLFGCSPAQLARYIQDQVYVETGIRLRVGIGENKILAKMACDNYAKLSTTGIYELTKEILPETLWKHPVGDMFMVGGRMSRHFDSMGMRTIGSVAQTPLGSLKQKMRQKFGKSADVQAEMYWRIANGLDDSQVRPETHQMPPKSVGHQMTLPRDYYLLEDIKVVLLELTELVCRRSREMGCMGNVVSVGCTGSDFERPTGFSRQLKLPDPTNVTKQVHDMVMVLFRKHWNGLPVRRVGISLSGLIKDDEYQITMFDERLRYQALEKTTDEIKRRFGDSAILRASSLTAAGQAQRRSGLIGGHFK